MKLTLLQTAVHKVDDLRIVKTTADTLSSQTKLPVTYQMYYNLLMDAATSYDHQHLVKSSNQTNWELYWTMVDDDDPDNEDASSTDYSLPSITESIIDMSPTYFLSINQAWCAEQHPQTIQLPHDI